MSPLQWTELVAGVVVLLAVILVVFVWTRRQYISGGKPLMLCAIRTPVARSWRLGLLRFGPATLDWYSIIGPSMRPARSWPRWRVELGAPKPTRDVIPGLVDPVTVMGRDGIEEFDLALTSASHTAMRSWLESAPPGWGANVA